MGGYKGGEINQIVLIMHIPFQVQVSPDQFFPNIGPPVHLALYQKNMHDFLPEFGLK